MQLEHRSGEVLPSASARAWQTVSGKVQSEMMLGSASQLVSVATVVPMDTVTAARAKDEAVMDSRKPPLLQTNDRGAP